MSHAIVTHLGARERRVVGVVGVGVAADDVERAAVVVVAQRRERACGGARSTAGSR